MLASHESRSNDFHPVIGPEFTRSPLMWTLERDESQFTASEVSCRLFLRPRLDLARDGLAHFFQDVTDEADRARHDADPADDAPRQLQLARNCRNGAGGVDGQRLAVVRIGLRMTGCSLVWKSDRI